MPAPIPLVNMQKNIQGILTRAGKEHKLQDMNKTTALAQDIPTRAKVLVDTLVSTGCTIKEASKVAGYKETLQGLVLPRCYINQRYKST